MIQGRKLQYGYDNAGNQVSRVVPAATDKTWALTWSTDNRLTKMEKIKGTSEKETVTFKYDPFGKRIGKQYTTIIDGVTKTATWTYVYDKDNIALEIYTDENNATEKTWYTHGAGVDEHLGMERNSNHFYYHADGLGSVTIITNASAAVVQTYEYDSFGMPKPSTDFRNSYIYTGREWDKETGLYYYRARYYDPTEGRFISKDPISFAGGDVNVYGYVQNNSISRLDPLGLWYIDVNITGGNGKGGTAGVQIGSSGVYVYAGAGYGEGGGVSVTWNTGDPSTGLSNTAIASGGTGVVGGKATLSYDSTGVPTTGNTYGSLGGGWGVGSGVAVTGTYTYPVWQPKPVTCPK